MATKKSTRSVSSALNKSIKTPAKTSKKKVVRQPSSTRSVNPSPSPDGGSGAKRYNPAPAPSSAKLVQFHQNQVVPEQRTPAPVPSGPKVIRPISESIHAPVNQKNAQQMALQKAALQRVASPVSGPGVDTGGYTTGAETRSPVLPAPIAPTPEVTAPNARPVAPVPQIVTGGSSGAGSGGGQFRTIGNSGRGATLGMLQRLRNSRGPRTGLSLTPELLQRMAAQRISRQ